MKESLWQRFNMWIDPKFGWHALWIGPLLACKVIADDIQTQIKAATKKPLTEDQKRLQVLAGIRDDE